MFLVIVAGGRDFKDYAYLKRKLDALLRRYNPDEVAIVSGNARGADALGERYAKERGMRCDLFPADWDTHGKSAGYKRNKDMAEYADALVAFWDGSSKGTGHMIELACKNKLQVRTFVYENNL